MASQPPCRVDSRSLLSRSPARRDPGSTPAEGTAERDAVTTADCGAVATPPRMVPGPRSRSVQGRTRTTRRDRPPLRSAGSAVRRSDAPWDGCIGPPRGASARDPWVGGSARALPGAGARERPRACAPRNSSRRGGHFPAGPAPRRVPSRLPIRGPRLAAGQAGTLLRSRQDERRVERATPRRLSRARPARRTGGEGVARRATCPQRRRLQGSTSMTELAEDASVAAGDSATTRVGGRWKRPALVSRTR